MASKIPSNPSEWQSYANAYYITDMPYRNSLSKSADSYVERDVYVDATNAFQATSAFVEVYSDILALPSYNTSVTVPVGGAVSVTTRVITSISPVVLNIYFSGTSDAALTIFAATLDQPISISMGSSAFLTALDLGSGSGNAGVNVNFSGGSTTITYLTETLPLELASAEMIKLLELQLRIASILFWLSPMVAQALTASVARSTLNSQAGASLNIQANSLCQQLAAAALTGTGTTYAPALTLDTYKQTLDGAINVAYVFEAQYEIFRTRQGEVQDQKQAWDTMLGHAQDILNLQTSIVNEASAKWTGASKTLDTATWGMRYDQIDITEKLLAFQLGIADWKEKEEFQAVVEILFAVVSFVAAIGAMCVGDPDAGAGAPAEAEQAIAAIAKASESVAERFLSPDNLKNLKDGIDIANKLWDSTNKMVALVNGLISDPDAGLPPIPSGDSAVGDPEGLLELAAWDQWTLDVNDQMAFAVDQGINGAGDYLLALRKHAIDGKLVTQARVQAIKAGQEYAQAQLGLIAANNDLTRLQQLRDTYNGEITVAEEASAAFYDREMSIITGVLIELRKAVWAYQYLALQPSSVVLDPLKSIQDLQDDAQLIVQEVENWREESSSDFPRTLHQFSKNQSSVSLARAVADCVKAYDLPMNASEFNLGYATAIVSSLKSSTKATFTLSPSTTSPSSLSDVGPFADGSHVRTVGMRAYLIGAKPKSPKTTAVGLKISTSGIYSDIQSNVVSTFTMQPDSRVFQYAWRTPTAPGEDDCGVVQIDSFDPSSSYADVTPFTQWTIEISKPDLLDLSALTDVKFVWKGRARFTSAPFDNLTRVYN